MDDPRAAEMACLSSVHPNWTVRHSSAACYEVGSAVMSTMVMVGVLAGTGVLPFARRYWDAAIGAPFSGLWDDANLRAFATGLSVAQEGMGDR